MVHLFNFLKWNFLQGFVAKGWIELESGREAKKAIKYFDDAIG